MAGPETMNPDDVVRAGERHRVRQFASGARDWPAVLVIAGEAGAGKSTLWRAGTAAAAGAGHRVLRAEPSAAESGLAFAGLSDLFTEVLPGDAGDIPGPQREALEVALLLRTAGPEPPPARAVGLAVLAVLRRLATPGPVLVAIDDVHWLDEASRDALTFAFRRADGAAAGLLLAARTEAPADPLTAAGPVPSPSWRDLAAAGPAETVELSPLDAEQVRRLLPATVSAAQARLVAGQSRGNPFWAREIAASLESDGTPVPALARTLTGRLTRTLSPEGREALAVVAAAGRITVSAALAVLEYLEDPPLALDEAVRAGVVTEAGTAGRLTAAHPLIGAAAVELLPPVRRQQLYRQLAAAEFGPERYAHFAALAAAPGPSEDVAAALDAAAAAAHARAGNAEAAQFAVRAIPFTPPKDGDALTRRRLRAAELLFLAGEVGPCLHQATSVDLAELATPDLERLLPLLLDMTATAHGTAAAASIVTRLAGESQPDPRRRALILALASHIDYGIPGHRRAAATEAIHLAETAGPEADASLHSALLNLVAAKVFAGDGLDHSLLDRAEELEGRLPPDRLHDAAGLFRGVWSACFEDVDTARAALARSIDQARDAGDDLRLTLFLGYLAGVEELTGDYAAARGALTAADTASAWHDWPVLPWNAEPRCGLLIADGDLAGALALAARHLPGEPGHMAVTRFLGGLVRGRVSAWQGDTAGAIGWFERAAVGAAECDFADPGVRQGLDAALAEAYLAEGRVPDAQPISARLRENGQRLHRSVLTGNASRIDALAAALDGDLDAAADAARAAVAAHETTPMRPELARSLLVLGQVERRRRARRQSREVLTRAQGLARAMGHQPLLALISQELGRVDVARSGSELTATEQRVAELIASGATNRDAAAALFVSVRTVETHVGSIYRKLGVRSRVELARRFR